MGGEDKKGPSLRVVHSERKHHKLRHCALEFPDHMLFTMKISEEPGGDVVAESNMKIMGSNSSDKRFKYLAEFTAGLFENCEIAFDEEIKPDPQKPIA